MADTPNLAPSEGTPISGATPLDQTNPIDAGSSFLSETPNSQKSEDILYNDFFQENGSSEMTLWAKKERSGLELIVSILEYTTIILVIAGILSGLHVFIRSSDNVSFLENYPFLCPYLHYDINASSEEKWCKNIGLIGSEYNEKNKNLEENILSALTEYIPIKVSSSILDASPEKRFIISTYNWKPHVNNVLEAFERVKTNAQKSWPQSANDKNIKCSGITVIEGNILSTQCIIYGGAIGGSNTNWQIGSSRIEALDFMEKLSNTTKSSLILYNFPTTLSIEELSEKDGTASGFLTQTTIPIQVWYVPLIEKF
jgi:hypothetical protein